MFCEDRNWLVERKIWLATLALSEETVLTRRAAQACLMRGRPNRLRMAIRRPGACLSLLFLMALVVAAVFAPWLTPYAAQGAGAPDIAHRLLAPSSAHLLGTDEMGRDMLARVLYGVWTSLAMAALVVGSSVVVGIVVGLAAGYAGGWVDEGAMRTTDVFLAFPPLLLAILLVTVLGGGFASTMLALALVWWPVYAVLVRGQVVSVRSRPSWKRPAPLVCRRWGLCVAICCPTLWGRCWCKPRSTWAR